jgi:ribosomal protein S3
MVHLFSFRYLIFQYHENLVSKYFIFNFFSQVITLSLKKLHFTRKITSIRFIGLHDRNINANVLVNYIIIKLKQYILLNEIITPLLRRLKEHSNIIGFRIIVSGRLTRKDRAAFLTYYHNNLNLSTLSIPIDYAADFLIMKFGVVGIKLYLQCNKGLPYHYFFEFLTES